MNGISDIISQVSVSWEELRRRRRLRRRRLLELIGITQPPSGGGEVVLTATGYPLRI